MRDQPKEPFLREFSRALRERNAALFIGAGLSRPAGLSDWKELLREVADDLGLDIDREIDLIAIAQYHANFKGGKGRLNQLIIDEFTKEARRTENHAIIASLPLRTIWTTNYDTLIEDAFAHSGRRADVKHNNAQLAYTKPRADVRVYKMHGDVSMPSEAVLTKDDYEIYGEKRALFTEALKGDLVNKTFLFLGFSFTDPNIDYILSRIRVLLGSSQREHYCVMKKPDKPTDLTGAAGADYEYELKRLSHRVEDLKRFSIQTILIDNFSEITEVLRELDRRSHSLDVFVSGSAAEYGTFTKERTEGLCRALGQELITHGLNLISGFGFGIGGAVIIGAVEAVYRTDDFSIEDRIMLRPFPQILPGGLTRDQFNTQYRKDMISKAGHCIFIAGNRLNMKTGETEKSAGVREEFEIALSMGKTVIPIGVTGSMASELYQEVIADVGKYFPRGNVQQSLETLNDANKSDADLVQAVIQIIRSTGGQ